MGYSFGIVPNPEQLAAEISTKLPSVMSGTLRFWGEWFGRPYDNRQVVSCDATDDYLRLHFSQGEVLAVWNPTEVEIDANKFRIGSAKALRWTWYYYGRPQKPENLFYMDYAHENGSVLFRINWDQIPGSGSLDSADSFPAVEMF
jgi:hypothetical protein